LSFDRSSGSAAIGNHYLSVQTELAMRRTSLWTVLLFFSLSANGQYWTPLAPYPVAVSGAYGFNIEGRLFVGGGISSYDPLVGHAGFYEYLPDSDQWLARATPPFGALYRAATDQWDGLVVGGSRVDTAFHPTNELWHYDPLTDTWTQKASLPGIGREGLVVVPFDQGWPTFQAGLGGDPGMNDWYQYDGYADQWSTLPSLPGPGRTGAVGYYATDTHIALGLGAVSLSDTGTTFPNEWYWRPGVLFGDSLTPWIPAPGCEPLATARAGAALAGQFQGDAYVWWANVSVGGLGMSGSTPSVLGDLSAVTACNDHFPLGPHPDGPLAHAVALYQMYYDMGTVYIGTGCTALIPGTWNPQAFTNAFWRYTIGGLELGMQEQGLGELTWSWQDDHVLLHWPATTDRVEIDVLDVLGRVVQPTRRYDGRSMLATIEMNTPGTYLLRWRSGDDQQVIRFVKP